MDTNIADIRHEEADGRGVFFIERDGRRLALQTYRRLDESRVSIVHTEVESELQGRGIARRLLDTLVAWARDSGTRVTATCSYARAQFERDSSIRDVFEG